MDALTTINPRSQAYAHSSNSFTTKAFDYAITFGRKVVPLAAGSVFAWLSLTTFPAIGALCFTAGALWTSYLVVIRPLCSYVISFFCSEKIKRQSKQDFDINMCQITPSQEGSATPKGVAFDSSDEAEAHINNLFAPFINKRVTFPSDNEYLVSASKHNFLKLTEIEKERIENQFNKDFTRNMHFKMKSPDGVTCNYYRSADGTIHLQKQQHGNVLAEIKYNRSKSQTVLKEPGGSEYRHSTEDNIIKLETACRAAFTEIGNGNDDLTIAAMDLTTQGSGNALYLFVMQLYSSLYPANSTIAGGLGNPVIAFGENTIRTELEKDEYGIINVQIHCEVPSCKILIPANKNQYMVHQKLEIKTSVVLDPKELNQRRFGEATVEFGELRDFTDQTAQNALNSIES